MQEKCSEAASCVIGHASHRLGTRHMRHGSWDQVYMGHQAPTEVERCMEKSRSRATGRNRLRAAQPRIVAVLSCARPSAPASLLLRALLFRCAATRPSAFPLSEGTGDRFAEAVGATLLHCSLGASQRAVLGVLVEGWRQRLGGEEGAHHREGGGRPVEWREVAGAADGDEGDLPVVPRHREAAVHLFTSGRTVHPADATGPRRSAVRALRPLGSRPNGRHGCVRGRRSGAEAEVLSGPTGVHWSASPVPLLRKGAQMSSIGAVCSPHASESPS